MISIFFYIFIIDLFPYVSKKVFELLLIYFIFYLGSGFPLSFFLFLEWFPNRFGSISEFWIIDIFWVK